MSNPAGVRFVLVVCDASAYLKLDYAANPSSLISANFAEKSVARTLHCTKINRVPFFINPVGLIFGCAPRNSS